MSAELAAAERQQLGARTSRSAARSAARTMRLDAAVASLGGARRSELRVRAASRRALDDLVASRPMLGGAATAQRRPRGRRGRARRAAAGTACASACDPPARPRRRGRIDERSSSRPRRRGVKSCARAGHAGGRGSPASCRRGPRGRRRARRPRTGRARRARRACRRAREAASARRSGSARQLVEAGREREQVPGQVAAVDRRDVHRPQRLEGPRVVPVVEVPPVARHPIQRRERPLRPRDHLARGDVAEVVGGEVREQRQADVGRRGAVRDPVRRILLEVVRRQIVVLRPDERLEEPPGPPRDACAGSSRRRRDSAE